MTGTINEDLCYLPIVQNSDLTNTMMLGTYLLEPYYQVYDATPTDASASYLRVGFGSDEFGGTTWLDVNAQEKLLMAIVLITLGFLLVAAICLCMKCKATEEESMIIRSSIPRNPDLLRGDTMHRRQDNIRQF